MKKFGKLTPVEFQEFHSDNQKQPRKPGSLLPLVFGNGSREFGLRGCTRNCESNINFATLFKTFPFGAENHLALARVKY